MCNFLELHIIYEKYKVSYMISDHLRKYRICACYSDLLTKDFEVVNYNQHPSECESPWA
jgi:hypothetical protein